MNFTFKNLRIFFWDHFKLKNEIWWKMEILLLAEIVGEVVNWGTMIGKIELGKQPNTEK